ncbi:MAG: diaminopimelate decarboxylase, partial [Thermodesulfobacteriota bacterium]|nr:diaminopimelate decarboxylase [Thermodesulfobacteriota bacterium]
IAEALGKKARISIRVNPDVDPKTHPYISTGLKENKFGLDLERSLAAYRAALDMPGVEPVGIDCHIGSQVTEMGPFLEALDKVLQFYEQLKGMGFAIRYLDLGGGLGIRYHEEEPPHPAQLGEALTKRLQGFPLTLILEPGRVIAGNAGILVTRVLYTKDTPSKHFVIVDAAMNDLVRPSFYGSYHYIAEVTTHQRTPVKADVVGPVCESSDFLAQDRALPQMCAGECLAVFSAGAYGFAMGSQYNSRPRPAEILVDDGKIILARRRETYEDLVALERGNAGE